MNKIKYFAMAAFAALGVVSMTSCSDDDNTAPKKIFVELNGEETKLPVEGTVVWTDATSFNGELYNLVVSVVPGEEGNIEHYDLLKSADGKTWTKVEYTVDGEKGLIGGEGARLYVYNNQLCVWGGMRSKGGDIYGGEVEAEDGWMGPSPVAYRRLYTSSNGTAFTTVQTTVKRGETDYTEMTDMFGLPYASVAVVNGKVVINGGFQIGFGMMQASRTLMVSENGTDFEVIAPVDAEGNTMRLPDYMSSMYVIGDKLFIAGGINNYITPDFVQNTVFSSTDLTTWTIEEPAEGSEFPTCFNAKVLSNGQGAVLLGGEIYNEAGALAFDKNIYLSQDGVNWTAAAAPEGFEGYRMASAFVADGHVYVLGGFTTNSSGYYGGPVDDDVYTTKAWTIKF